MIYKRLQQYKNRINARTFIILKNAVYSLGIKGLSFIVGLLLMPVYAKFLINQSVLGVWLTMISMLSWIFMLDLGIGNGLRNELTVAFAQDDKTMAKRIIISGYVSSALICLILAAVLFACVAFIDFAGLFHIDGAILDDGVIRNSIRLLLIGVLLQFMLKLINSILLALQKSAVPNALNLVSNVLLLGYMLLAPVDTVNRNFASLSVIYVVTTNLPVLLATVVVFLTVLRDYIPSLRDFSFADAKRIMKLSLAFFGVYFMAMIILCTNNFLISVFVNAGEVVSFQIYYKLFGMISTLFSIGMTPVWSSVTDAQAKSDFRWIIKIRKKLFLLMGIAAAGEIVVLLFSRFIVTVWMGPQYALSDYMPVVFVVLLDLVNIWSMINAQIANGLSKLKNQLLFISLGAVINFPLSYIFSVLYRSWAAVVLANIFSLLPFCITETFSTARYLKRRDGRIPDKSLHARITRQADVLKSKTDI